MAKPKYISKITWRSTEKSSASGPVARGSLEIGDQLFINISVWDNNGDLIVRFPGTPNPNFDSSQPVSKENRKVFDEVGPLSREARTDVIEHILADLARVRNGGASQTATSSRGNTSTSRAAVDDDPMPF